MRSTAEIQKLFSHSHFEQLGFLHISISSRSDSASEATVKLHP